MLNLRTDDVIMQKNSRQTQEVVGEIIQHPKTNLINQALEKGHSKRLRYSLDRSTLTRIKVSRVIKGPECQRASDTWICSSHLYSGIKYKFNENYFDACLYTLNNNISFYKGVHTMYISIGLNPDTTARL